MNDGNSRPPDVPGLHIPGMRRRVGLLAAAVAVAGLGSVVALSSLGGSHLSNAQVTSPTPNSAPWTPPTSPPLQYVAPTWLDPTGQALAKLVPGTIEARCTHNNFTMHVTPQLPSYPRNTPVLFRYSIIFTGPHPCYMESQTVPTFRIFDSAHNFVWVSDGKYGGALADTPAAQLTAAGDALTGDVAWEQDMCVFGNCPETEVPAGTYGGEVWFWPFGQSQPATVQLAP
jgi:hypothetical protein